VKCRARIGLYHRKGGEIAMADILGKPEIDEGIDGK
jgi:hypothetical protein